MAPRRKERPELREETKVEIKNTNVIQAASRRTSTSIVSSTDMGQRKNILQNSVYSGMTISSHVQSPIQKVRNRSFQKFRKCNAATTKASYVVLRIKFARGIARRTRHYARSVGYPNVRTVATA